MPALPQTNTRLTPSSPKIIQFDACDCRKSGIQSEPTISTIARASVTRIGVGRKSIGVIGRVLSLGNENRGVSRASGASPVQDSKLTLPASGDTRRQQTHGDDRNDQQGP